VFLDQFPDFSQLHFRQPKILGQLNARLDPEFRLSSLAADMDMHPRFFTGEEIEAEPAFSEHRRTHIPLPEKTDFRLLK
jgi:hypothetical protein